MSIDKGLLDILCCPVTKTPVKPLPADRLAIINREIEKGEIKYVDGSAVEEPLEEALITTDGKTVYRIDDGIPIMLEDQGIIANQVSGW
ncbi:MAG: Trm112 family protein [Gammaproteobacteria bacterium]|nr:Trm112 family protein [Gammaproteobacteria bacterium]